MLIYVIKQSAIKTSVTVSICNQRVPYKNISWLLVYVIKQSPIKTSVTVSICTQTVPYKNFS